MYGKNWRMVEKYIKTRSGTQIRSHAQKYYSKQEQRPSPKKSDPPLKKPKAGEAIDPVTRQIQPPTSELDNNQLFVCDEEIAQSDLSHNKNKTNKPFNSTPEIHVPKAIQSENKTNNLRQEMDLIMNKISQTRDLREVTRMSIQLAIISGSLERIFPDIEISISFSIYCSTRLM